MDTECAERGLTDEALLRWFEQQHLLRLRIVAEDAEHIVEEMRAPMVLLSAREEDARAAPNPDALGYPEKRLSEIPKDKAIITA